MPEATPLIPPAAQSAADRFGCSLAFVRLHWGPHTCLDSKPYASGCLITDPAREAEALRLMTSVTRIELDRAS